jgi:endonuclease-3
MLEVFEKLEEVYQGEVSGLKFVSPFELLIAVILSAQCTDVRVNQITMELFKKYKGPQDFAKAKQEELEQDIKSCGCYRVKAKSLRETSRALLEQFHGQVPDTREELMSLQGVGRKTANVVLAFAFGKPAIAVDTHVFRVSHRLHLSAANTPDGVEQDLMRLLPEEKWGQAHHWLIWHGRRLCKAQSPLCPDCFLKDICPYENKTKPKAVKMGG